MLHESHSAVSGPALLVIVTYYVLIVGIRVLSEVSLNKFSRFLLCESKHHIQLVDVSAVESDWVSSLSLYILEAHELIRSRGRSSQLSGSLKAKDYDVKDEAVVLSDKACELKTSDKSIGVGVRHVLEGDYHVVLRSHVVSQIVIDNQSQ